MRFSPPLLLLSFVAVLFQSCLCPADAHGQAQQLPHRSYYFGFADLYEGDFRSALRRFNSEYRTAFRFGESRYVDSVCILAMIGECHYRVGDYQTALQRYNEALELYVGLNRQGWQSNIRVPDIIQSDTSALQRAGITWGRSKRNGQIANVSDGISVLRGRLDASRAFEQGGTFDPAEIRQVDVTEVFRCAALAIQRRRQISGPTGRYDPNALRLAGSVKKSGIGNGTLLGAYNGVVYGMAMSAIGEHDKAAIALSGSLQLQGGLDHRLTPLALSELAHIGVLKEQPDLALDFALEATYAGAYFQQPDVVEEGFTIATRAHLMTQRSPLPALEPAIQWASRERTQMLETSLKVNLAECLSESGDAVLSNQALSQAGNLMTNRNQIAQTPLVGKLRYLTAVNKFLTGDTRGGLTALRAAMKELTAKSPALFRLQLADNMAANQSLTEKQADRLYTKLLQDPSQQLWRTEPMDAISFLLTPHVSALERWFEILINRKQIDRAVEVADQIRRHRFYADLPLGGRLLSLRWVLQGDVRFLKPDALKQRQELLTRHSGYRDLLNQATLLKDRLSAIVLQPVAESNDDRAQRQTMRKLADIYTRQESLIASMALRREPAEMAFPPIGNASDLQGFVQPNQIVFSVLQTAAGYHIFFFDDQRARYLGLVDAGALKKGVGKLLGAMGVAANYADPQLLATDAWKEAVSAFQENLFEDIPADQLAAAKELIVIPDGLLWYVPIEAFLIGDGDDQRPLIQTTKVRYCPTLFLAFARPSSDGEIKTTGVVTGAMYPQTDSSIAEAVFTEVLEKEIDAKDLVGSRHLPGDQLAGRLDQLVVLQSASAKNGAFNLQPLQTDSGRKKSQAQGTLLDWMEIPFAAPDHVVMTGLNSIGGAGGIARPDGSEMFFTATSIMAAGGRSVLLSRWNAGGQTQAELGARYGRYAAAMPVTLALQNAIKHVQSVKIDRVKEPRVKADANPHEISADHPFFWAGPMLVSYDDQRGTDPAVLASLDNPAMGEDHAAANAADPAMPKGEMKNVKMQPVGIEKTQPPEGEKEKINVDQGSTKKDVDHENLEGEDGDDQQGAVWKIGGKNK